jgi:hypothetical protein
VISHRMWQSEFDGANVPGNRICIDKVKLPIAGVAPKELEGLYSDRAVDLWMPLQERSVLGAEQGRRDLWVLARLRQGVSTSQVQTALRQVFRDSREVDLVPFTGAAPRVARGLARIGALLDFAVGGVFLIACFNVATQLFGRALKRSRETSLRIALGATRAALMRELLSDSIVISLAGGAFGILLAVWTAHIIPALLFEVDAERLIFAPHMLLILTSSIFCAGVIVVCGIVPAVTTRTDRPWTILQREGGLPSRAMERLRAGLVGGQITSCCVLLIYTTVILEGLQSALETNAGHRLGDPVLVTLQAPAQPGLDLKYFGDVERAARSQPGLHGLTWADRLPGNQPEWRSYRMQPSDSPLRDVWMDINWFTPDSFQFLEERPIAGRFFGIQDQVRRTAIVNEEAAAELFGRNTVGMSIRDPSGQPVDIIGVARKNSAYARNNKRPAIYYYSGNSHTPDRIANARFQVPAASPQTNIEMDVNVVSSSYFNVMGLTMSSGQPFPERQVLGQYHIGVINQEAADLYFSGRPLGAALIDEDGIRTVVTGVVRSQAFGTFQRQAEPALYLPMWQDCPPRMTMILATSMLNDRVLTELRHRIEAVAGHDSPPEIKMLDAHMAQSALAPLRIATLIAGVSASTALVLSVLGLFCAHVDVERQRMRELALHIALGVPRWRIALKVLKKTSKIACVGSGIGIAVSLALMRALADNAGILHVSLRTWLIVPMVPMAVVVVAGALPASRAFMANTLTIMRDDS